MKKLVLILIAGLVINYHSLSQKSEYRYPAIKFGLSNGFNPKPTFNPNKYIYAPGPEEMQLHPTGSAYVPGFVFAFLYHFDFVSDNAGIFTGLEYNMGGIGGKYNTNYINYTMKEIYRSHSVGIPIAFKYGPDLWKTQKYVYAGAQINFMVAMSSVQKASWTKELAGTKLTTEEFNRVGFNVFAGVNYLAFNLELDFYPKTFFNRLYTAPSGYSPYAGEPEKAFMVKTTINVPYGWLSQKSFWWRKHLRGFPLWK